MILQFENVSYSYQNHTAIRGISFRMQEGEKVGLVGANGAGKSTLLRIPVGLGRDYTGAVTVGTYPVRKEHDARVRRICGYVFQDSENQLFMNRVEEDVAFGPLNYGLTKEEAAKKAEAALASVRIEYLKERPVWQLSGGEKKLAAIATVLAMDPEIVLFDEPSAALDPKNRRNLIRVLRELPHAELVASHDLDFILDTCSRVLLLSKGELVADGAAEEILSDRVLLEAHGLELPLTLQKR